MRFCVETSAFFAGEQMLFCFEIGQVLFVNETCVVRASQACCVEIERYGLRG